MRSPKWTALAREGTSAAEHILFGATALGRANYANSAHYTQGFFSLSIGFERAAKLALVVDHALRKGGAFPDNAILRSYGHRLDELLGSVRDIASRHGTGGEEPTGPIHSAIVATLAQFANNVTRYYNLDLVTEAPKAAGLEDPISRWYREVTVPVLETHYGDAQRARHEARAAFAEEAYGHLTLVRHTSETGDPIASAQEAIVHAEAGKVAKRWERMYVLRIGRFLGLTLIELSHAANRAQVVEVPDFGDMFGILNNKDRYFRDRATWSIYRA